uniref:Uncharacterized protein n=1 Tax=Meloidogyne enterolobii TaxID=390850 RepID=A0A6V7WMX0_MELEN|nr:unnamed protein product [Meloidogyne enterolobii]
MNLNKTSKKTQLTNRMVNITVRMSSNASITTTIKPTTKLHENKTQTKINKIREEKKNITGSFERIEDKNINERQNLYTNMDNENETMTDYYDYYNETDEIASQTFFVAKNFTKKIEEIIYNQEINESNMEIYEEELQAEGNDERLEEVNLVKGSYLI